MLISWLQMENNNELFTESVVPGFKYYIVFKHCYYCFIKLYLEI